MNWNELLEELKPKLNRTTILTGVGLLYLFLSWIVWVPVLILTAFFGEFGGSLIDYVFSWTPALVGVVWSIAVTAAFVIYFVIGLTTVKESELWVMELLGKYSGTRKPGLTLILPWIETVRKKVTKREQYVEILIGTAGQPGTYTLDNVAVRVESQLFFKLADDPDAAWRATYGVEMSEEDPEEALRTLVMTVARSVVGTKTVEYLKNNQDEFSGLVLAGIREPLGAWGFVPLRHTIKDLLLPEEVMKALEATLIAKNQGSANVATAEAQAKVTVVTATAEREKRVLAADAGRQEQILDAEGEAARLTKLGEALSREGTSRALAFDLTEKAIANLGKGTLVTTTNDLVSGLVGTVAAAVKVVQESTAQTEAPPSTKP